MHARLILTAGSRAGLVARIHEGVYLIGRDKMCQIRPKSRSVSRRHCAVFNDSGSIRVLDLGSTAGTLVNGEKIPERKRVEVFDGDQIRCGKISFSVAISTSEETPIGSGFQSSEDSVTSYSQTIVTGEAMRESDIADLWRGWHQRDAKSTQDFLSFRLRWSTRCNIREEYRELSRLYGHSKR